MDLLQVMMKNKEEINANTGKGQSGSEQSAIPCGSWNDQIPIVQDRDSGNFERTMLFLNTKALAVYFEGMAGDQ